MEDPSRIVLLIVRPGRVRNHEAQLLVGLFREAVALERELPLC